MSTPEENPKENDLVLAVVIPEGATAGSTFHVSVENRFFEVTTPEGVQPGQTINLIVRAEQQDESKFKSVVDVRDAVLNQAKQGADALGITERVQGLDEKYHVSERAKSITNTAVTRVSDFDTRFAISSRVNSILASLDSRLHVQAAAIKTGEFIIGYAREIDARLAVSATSAKVVVASANVILAAYKKALAINEHHQITNTASSVASTVSSVANSALKAVGLSKGATVPPTAEPAVTDENVPAKKF